MRRTNLLKIYRINDWIHYLGFFILGYTVYGIEMTDLFILQIIEVSMILAYAYSINQIFDEKIDRKYITLSIIPLVISFILLLFLDMTKSIFILCFIILSTLYSVPRIRLKSIPIICSLSNTIGFSLLFLIGASNILMSVLTIRLFFILFLLQSSAQFIHELSHMGDDKKNGLMTTALFIGEDKTKKAYSISLILSSIISLSFINSITSLILVSIPTILFSSYFIISVDKIKISKLRKRYRIFGTFVGVLFLLNNIIIKM